MISLPPKSLILALAVAMSPCVSVQCADRDAARDLASPAGLMRLVPELKNEQGQFEIPNPKTDLPKFLRVHRALTNVVEMALAQANAKGDPYKVSATAAKALVFPKNWRCAEIGVKTDGSTVSFPDDGKLSAYGGVSFLTGISPIPGTDVTFYAVSKPDGTVPAIVYAEPTILPCVNRIVLAAANSGGFWQSPSYALGNDAGEAWLIVDKCVDVAQVATGNGQQRLIPNAELFTAIHWADTPAMEHMRTGEKGHTH
jgi:hypothetical protein